MTYALHDLAWAAGIFDGEGTLNFSFRQHRASAGHWQIRARVAMTHRPTIEHLVLIFGGTIQSRPPRSDRHRPTFIWQRESRAAEDFLTAIMPFSVTKRRQIELALDGAALRRESPRIKRGRGNGRGAPSIAPETHAALRQISDEIKAVNRG